MSEWNSPKGNPGSGGSEGSKQVSRNECFGEDTFRHFVELLCRPGSIPSEAGGGGKSGERTFAVGWLPNTLVVRPADKNSHRSGSSASPGGNDSPDERGPGSRRPRKRRAGRRGPERFDADYYLRRLLSDEAKTRREAGDTQSEIDAAVALLTQKSAEQLAEEIERRFGPRISGKTIRRNSTVYKDWAQFREAAQARRPVDLGRQPSRETTPGTKAQIAEQDVINGQLSHRQGVSGPIRGRSREDCVDDAEADAFFRNNGVNPGEFPAE